MKKKILALTLSLALCFGVTGYSSYQSNIELSGSDINKYIDLVVVSEDSTVFGIVEVAYVLCKKVWISIWNLTNLQFRWNS